MVRKLSIVVVVAAVAACSKAEAPAVDSTASGMKAMPDSTASMQAAPAAGTGITMRDAAGQELGTLTLSEMGGSLMLAGALKGLPPGTHAIHFHATGQCVAPFESAGKHWNPTNKQHGSENPAGPHLGDMANFTVAADSSATISVMTAGGTLRGADAVLDADGVAVVIHAGSDDMKTDPAGNSGAKIACGAASGG